MGNLEIAEPDTGSNLWRTSNCTNPRLPFLHTKSNSSPTFPPPKKNTVGVFPFPSTGEAEQALNLILFGFHCHSDIDIRTLLGLGMSICALWMSQALKLARKTDSKTQCFGNHSVWWRSKLKSLYFWEIKYKI